MHPDRHTLERQFVCPKCRGRGAVVQELQLSRGGMAALLPLAAGRFLAASCGLCGYTEFYSMAAVDPLPAEADEAGQEPQAAGDLP